LGSLARKVPADTFAGRQPARSVYSDQARYALMATELPTICAGIGREVITGLLAGSCHGRMSGLEGSLGRLPDVPFV
jgi:hypothetical protein